MVIIESPCPANALPRRPRPPKAHPQEGRRRPRTRVPGTKATRATPAVPRATPPTPDERRNRRPTTDREIAAARGATLDELLALVARVTERLPANVAPADVFAIAIDNQTEFRFVTR
jgi:hypothetical protein